MKKITLKAISMVLYMPPLDDEPVAYLIRNDGAENEYYMVENCRQ